MRGDNYSFAGNLPVRSAPNTGLSTGRIDSWTALKTIARRVAAPALVGLLALVIAAATACGAGQDRARRGRTGFRTHRARSRQADHAGAAPQDGGGVAHLLAQSGRLRPADHDHLEASRWRRRGRDPMARAAHAADGPARQLRLRGRSAAADRAHGAARCGRRVHVQAGGACGLAGLQGRLHSGRRGPRHRAAGGRPLGSLSAVGQRHRGRARGASHAACRAGRSTRRGDGATSRADADAARRRAPIRVRCSSSRTTRAASSLRASRSLARDAQRRLHVDVAGGHPAGARFQAGRRRRHCGQGLRRGRRTRRRGDHRRAVGRHGHRGRQAPRRAGALGRSSRRRPASARGPSFRSRPPCCWPSSAA